MLYRRLSHRRKVTGRLHAWTKDEMKTKRKRRRTRTRGYIDIRDALTKQSRPVLNVTNGSMPATVATGEE